MLLTRNHALGAALVVLSAAFISGTVLSDDKPASPPSEPEAMQKMMEMMKAKNAKGPEHDKFKDMVGTWTTETKMWMLPDAPPMVSEGKAEFQLLFDGRFLQQDYQCDMGGTMFHGRGIEAYDTLRKKYVSIWFDDSSTGIFMSEGKPDEDGKSITYFGKLADPMMGGKEKVVRSVIREIDKDTAVFEMYDKFPGMDEEFKTMEITYRRKS